MASLANYLRAIAPRYWQLPLGVLFVVVILYLRGGIAGGAMVKCCGRRGHKAASWTAAGVNALQSGPEVVT